MYVPKKYESSVPFAHKFLNVLVMCGGSKFALGVEVSPFPCGRVRLIARSAGFIVTGNMSNIFKDITFDSIRSLYTCPGFSVLTPPDVVYSACGRRFRRVW